MNTGSALTTLASVCAIGGPAGQFGGDYGECWFSYEVSRVRHEDTVRNYCSDASS